MFKTEKNQTRHSKLWSLYSQNFCMARPKNSLFYERTQVLYKKKEKSVGYSVILFQLSFIFNYSLYFFFLSFCYLFTDLLAII